MTGSTPAARRGRRVDEDGGKIGCLTVQIPGFFVPETVQRTDATTSVTGPINTNMFHLATSYFNLRDNIFPSP